MNNQTIKIIIDGLVIVAALLSVIFTFGVVWRVEKELDISYKLFLGAIIVFTLGELVNFFEPGNGLLITGVNAFSKIIFVSFFLGGILTMRDLIRKMDGEKTSDDFYANIPAKEE